MSNILDYTKFLSKEELFLKDLIFCPTKINSFDIEKINFERLVKIASSNLLLPLLYLKLEEKKFLNKIPAELKIYLHKIYQLNKHRNEELKIEVFEISSILKKNDINHVFIKGSAYIFSEIYSCLGERMIGDIDILVNVKESEKAANALQKVGYKNTTKYQFFEKRHLTRKAHPKKTFAVEVHFDLFDKKKLINISDFLKNRIVKGGVSIPNYEHQILYSIYSNQINDLAQIQLSYNYRSYYDTNRLMKKSSLDFQPKNNYFNTYFLIANHLRVFEFKFNNQKKYKLLSLKFKYLIKSKKIRLVNNCLVGIVLKIEFRAKQINEILKNKKYRMYILKKLFNT